VEGLKDREVYLSSSRSVIPLAGALEDEGRARIGGERCQPSDSDIAPAFISNKSVRAVVTWNRWSEIEQTPGVKGASSTPRRPRGDPRPAGRQHEDARGPSELAGGARGAWYEVMQLMSTPARLPTRRSSRWRRAPAARSSSTRRSCRTTAMYWTPQAALDFTNSERLKQKMDFVRNFCFKHGLLGEDAKSVDVVGISYPTGPSRGTSRTSRCASRPRSWGRRQRRAEEVILRDFLRNGAEPSAASACPRERALHRARGGIRRGSYYRHLDNPADQVMPGRTDDRGR